jgi:hypothetical protein
MTRITLGLLATMLAAPAAAQINAPGDTAVLTLGAAGVQIYECRAAAGGPAWAFVAPRAVLTLDGRLAGTHGAGPFWMASDGSRVVGRVVGRADAPAPASIPWLRLEVAERSGSGAFTAVTHILRVNTLGGVLSGPCPTIGAVQDVPYTTDYVMVRNP